MMRIVRSLSCMSIYMHADIFFPTIICLSVYSSDIVPSSIGNLQMKKNANVHDNHTGHRKLNFFSIRIIRNELNNQSILTAHSTPTSLPKYCEATSLYIFHNRSFHFPFIMLIDLTSTRPALINV